MRKTFDGARWIAPTGIVPNGTFAAYRTTLTLPAWPCSNSSTNSSTSSTGSSAMVHIAADTKYWLYVNGELVLFEGGLKRGPAPGAGFYDSVDLAQLGNVLDNGIGIGLGAAVVITGFNKTSNIKC